MLKKLGWFLFLLRHALGVVAFATLFSAPILMQLKIFLGSSLLLIVLYFDAIIIDREGSYEQLLSLLEMSFTHLEAVQKATTDQSVSNAFKMFWAQRCFDDVAAGSGVSYIFFLLSKYVSWVVGGWAVSTYFLIPNSIFG